MTKFTYGVYLGLFLGLFSSIVVYYFLPDLFPIYPNILSIFFFLSLLFALLRFIYKKVKQKSHQKWWLFAYLLFVFFIDYLLRKVFHVAFDLVFWKWCSWCFCCYWFICWFSRFRSFFCFVFAVHNR